MSIARVSMHALAVAPETSVRARSSRQRRSNRANRRGSLFDKGKACKDIAQLDATSGSSHAERARHTAAVPSTVTRLVRFVTNDQIPGTIDDRHELAPEMKLAGSPRACLHAIAVALAESWPKGWRAIGHQPREDHRESVATLPLSNGIDMAEVLVRTKKWRGQPVVYTFMFMMSV